MLLTNEQLHEIRRIISDHHQAFIVNTMGPDAVTEEVLEDLRRKGLVDVQVNSVEDAYLYGQVLAATDDPKVAKMSYEEFKGHLRQHPIPLNDIERRAIQFAQQQNAQYVVGLGNRVNQQTGQLMIEADAQLRAELRGKIRDATAENLAKRESIQKLKKDLGWATKDWARDLGRIATTEKHAAMQRGVADSIGERYGPDAQVAKRPAPDACEQCKKHYLGPDGHPRIFELKNLEANGLNNFGRKVADWLPVLGPMHPWCGCQLIRVPDGWGFDEDGSLSPDGEGGVVAAGPEDFELSVKAEADLIKGMRIVKRVEFQGLPIAIENTVGSKREWTDEYGNPGHTFMVHAYGHVEGTEGADGDEIDVFLGPDPRATHAYVIHQQKPANGIYDEDKVMLGFSSTAAARWAYFQNYDKPDFLITVSPIPMDQFKRWIQFTEPKSGDMCKSRFVLPSGRSRPDHQRKQPKGFYLRKARVSPEVGAAMSPAGGRNPGTGTGAVNLTVGSERQPPAMVENLKPTPREVVEAQAHFRDRSSGQREDLDLLAEIQAMSLGPGIRETILDTQPYGVAVDKDDVEAHREFLDKVAERKKARNRNMVEVMDKDSRAYRKRPLSKDDA